MIEQFGHVTWNVHELIADGLDADPYPDVRLVEGHVDFIPSVITVNLPGLTTIPTQKRAHLEIVPAQDGPGEESRLRHNGAEGIWLMASVDHRGSPQQWYYTARFEVYTNEGERIDIPPARFYLEPDQEIDLSTAIANARNYQNVNGGLLVPSVYILQDPDMTIEDAEGIARPLGATHILDTTSPTQDLLELI